MTHRAIILVWMLLMTILHVTWEMRLRSALNKLSNDLDAGQSSQLYGYSGGGIGISQHTTSRPLTETLLKRLKECKHVLHQKEKEPGDNHPDTLNAMEFLAQTYYGLGQFRQAKVPYTAVLQKRKTIVGDDHPDTLQTMCSLAATYHHLGRYEKAAEFNVSALEKEEPSE
ncbi:hypothetical protein B0H13DRAFT_1891810 [Mycena leptocephala]|nr:hypothetical protein B0H13DRAFT_1891810 [Mycena leptocephala]